MEYVFGIAFIVFAFAFYKVVSNRKNNAKSSNSGFGSGGLRKEDKRFDKNNKIT